jgi:VWFA-related protein
MRLTAVSAKNYCLPLFAACALLAAGETPSPSSRFVNILALDAKGQPVADLTADDFQIFDQGKRQTIGSFHGPESAPGTKPTTLILFDLLNRVAEKRAYLTLHIAQALEPLPDGASVYLYLLTNRGKVFPVHAIGDPAKGNDGPWTRDTRTLLDHAIEKAYGFRPYDESDLAMRTSTTLQSLGELSAQLAAVPNKPKTMIWISTGVDNELNTIGCKEVMVSDANGPYLAGRCHAVCPQSPGKCLDYTPFLQHLSSSLAASGTVVDIVEQVGTGVLPTNGEGSAHDTLQKVADLTGGRLYPAGDVDHAIADSQKDFSGRYQIAFEPSVAAADGKLRKLRVTCARKGVHIEATRGYYSDVRAESH